MKNRKIREKNYIHDDNYYYTIMRKNIKKFRLEQKLTQQDLADMIEMSREYVCDIENESRNKRPAIYVIGRISESLGKNIGDFFIKEDE